VDQEINRIIIKIKEGLNEENLERFEDMNQETQEKVAWEMVTHDIIDFNIGH